MLRKGVCDESKLVVKTKEVFDPVVTVNGEQRERESEAFAVVCIHLEKILGSEYSKERTTGSVKEWYGSTLVEEKGWREYLEYLGRSRLSDIMERKSPKFPC